MQINWFTFGMQIVNFLVLVWLLKRFLYGPIIEAMDAREQRIAERIAEAERSRQNAAAEAEEYRRKTEEMQHTKDELLSAATREIDEWKKEHLERAKTAVEESREEWFRGIQRERSALLRDLRRRTGEQVQQTARQVLAHLSGSQLEDQVLATFLIHLTETKFQPVAGKTEEHSIVVTAFPLTSEQQDRITGAIHERFGNDIELEFRTNPELVCGIQLRFGGHKFGWSVGDTLDQLAEDFEKALDEASTR